MIEYEITLNCNFRCGYCTNGRNTVISSPIYEGPLDKIIDNLSKHDEVYIYGGEPLMSKNIKDVVRYLRDSGKAYVIQTNFSITKSIEEILEIDPLVKFQVSIHRTQKQHTISIDNVLRFSKNIERCDIMFTSHQDLALYYKLNPIIRRLYLIPVADFATSKRDYLHSLVLYNKLRKILNNVRFDSGERSVIWEEQFTGILSPKGKRCMCIGKCHQMDPSGNMHHCPQRYDGDICPFESCFNLDRRL